MTQEADVTAPKQHRLSWPVLIGLILLILFVPAFIAVLGFNSVDVEDGYADVESVGRGLLAEDGSRLVLVLAVVAVLGWWGACWRERPRMRTWVWIVPGVLVVTSLAAMDFGRIGDAGLDVVAMLLLTTLAIAVAEEFMYRGVVLEAMRARYSEPKAVLFMCLLFGLSHIAGGPLQALVTIPAGYAYYVCKRVSGSLLVPIVVHALWDFSIFSYELTDSPAEEASGPIIMLLIELLLLIVLFFRRKHLSAPSIEPAPAS